MFGISGETTRQHPGHFPWVEAVVKTLAIMVVAGMVVVGALALTTDWFSGRSAPAVQPGQLGVNIGLAPVNNVPAQNEPEAVVLATPREVEVPWVLLGTGKSTTETADRLGIPWEKWTFIPALEAMERFNSPEHSSGWGTGTAYLLIDRYSTSGVPWVENPVLYFTANEGKTWFRVANPYPGESITSPDMVGALIEGDALVLFLDLQPEAFVTSWWRAEIPLDELEGLTP